MPDSFYLALPHLNASLNALAFTLIASGLVAVKRGRLVLHKRCMLGAAAVSALFLVSYVTYHLKCGSRRSPHHGWIWAVYITILLSHTILAVVQLPLIVITIVHGLRGRIDKHKKIAKITAPIWLYVSLTGVIVYLMLYQL